MQVYRVFFKIIRKNLTQILIYIFLFLFFAIFLANTASSQINTDFSETKINIAFINNDSNSKLVDGLKDYLGKNAYLVNIENDPEKLQDALFFRKIEYIVNVPEGFTEGLLKGEDVKIEKTIVPNSASGMYMDSIINKYINTAKTYVSTLENVTQPELVNYINEDLTQKTKVEILSGKLEGSKNEKCIYYYNYLAYSLFAVLILGVSTVMMVFSNSDLKKRNYCSPIKLKNMNFQMVLGNISFAILTWFIIIIASFIMYGSYMFTGQGLLFLLNSFIFTLAALSISFLIGNLLNSKGAISAASNVISLGTCFISGVFVPQVLLGNTVLTIASFTPNYWYVKSNHAIASLVNYNMESLAPILGNMLIVLGFAAAFLAVTLVVVKQKRTSA